MNRIYRLVWNHALKTVQVTSELATSRSGTARTRDNRIPALLALAISISLGLAALPAKASVCPPPGATGTYLCGKSGSAGGNGSYAAPGQGGLGSNPGDNNGGRGGMADSTGHNNQGHPGQGPGASGTGGNYLTHGMGSGGGGGKGYLNGLRKFANGGGGGGGGGVGASFSGTGNHNGAIIMGGNGGQGGVGAGIGHGGAGGGGGSAVWLDQDSHLINEGTGELYGGDGADGITVHISKTGAGDGGQGVSGIDFHLTNNGTIHGGNGGTGAYGDPDSPSGRFRGQSGGLGGAGVGGRGFTLSNNSHVTGGAGGNGGAMASGESGGAGVYGTEFTLTNHGTVSGGHGGNGGNYSAVGALGAGGTGGAGINGTDIRSLKNAKDGVIAGGHGGNGGNWGPFIPTQAAPGPGGAGGAGISIAGGTLINQGSITGGAGGDGGEGNSTRGGIGGAGVYGHSFMLINNVGGKISGGGGGDGGSTTEGQGGAGIASTGGSRITTAGSIVGGLSHVGGRNGRIQADAVDLSGGDNSLTLESGYSFVGNVISTSVSTNGGDTLVLGGTDNGKFDVSAIVKTAPTAYSGDTRYHGFSQYEKTGNGIWTLAGTTPVTTSWTIKAGTLSVSSDANLGDAGGILTFDGGALENTMAMSSGRNVTLNPGGGTFQTDANLTLSGIIGGKGGLTKTGTGTLILAATNTYTGGTTITAGTLQIGGGSGSGSIIGDITNNGTLTFDPALAVTFSGAIDGNGSILQDKSGTTLTLDGDSSGFTGTTTVQSSILIIGGKDGGDAALGGDVTVGYGGILGGHGTIGGNVTMDGGMVDPGNHDNGPIGTLTVDGNFTAQRGSLLQFDFGKPEATPGSFTRFGQGDSIVVGGNLTLDHVTLAVVDTGTMGPGLYNVFSWGGKLTERNGGLSLHYAPGKSMMLQTLTAQKQINLIDITGVTLDVWNANGKTDAIRMGGGDGTWSNTTKEWTNITGAIPNHAMQPRPGFALFGGDKGTVTVDDSADPVQATGMQFAVDGYTLTGDALMLVKDTNDNIPVIRVGNGSAASTNMSATIANVLSGSSGFIKTDLGTLVLSAANTYTGDTAVNGGTLEIAAGGTPGRGTVTVDGHAVLGAPDQNVTLQVDDGATIANHIVLDRGALLDNAGTITGNTEDSSVVESASGTATVHNHDGGAIAGVATGVALSAGGEVDNGATSTISGTTAVSIAGGPGTLRNAGTMIGNVMLDSGSANTVELTAGGAIQGNLSIGDDTASVLVLDGDNTTAQSYAKAVTGTTTFAGTLTKAGSGTWIIDNDALAGVTGVTTVKAGALIVGDDDSPDVTLGGAVTVAKGALLGGFGTVGSLDLAGTLATGHSLGTLHVAGDATFRPGSTWQVEVAPDGSSDQLDVTGKAILHGGHVTMLAQAGDIPLGTGYTILQAQGGIQGHFDSVDTNVNLTFLKPALTYLAHTVTLSLERNDISFADVAQTRNQKDTAAGAESLGGGNPVYDAIVIMDANQARGTFDQLSGEWYASMQTARLHDSRYVREAMNQRLTRAGTGDTADAARLGHTAGTVWFHAWGQWGDHDGDGNAARLRFHGSGLLVGVDAEVGDNARVGGVLGAGRTAIRDDQRASDGHDKATWLGVYGSAVTGPVHWRAGLAYARDRIDSNRRVTVADLAGSVGADPDGHTEQAWVEAALPFASAHGHAAPFLNLAHVRVATDGWREGGGPAALQGSGSDAKATLATLGIRSVWALADTEHPIRFHGRIGWRQAFGADTPQATMRLDGSAPFVVYGLPLAQHALVMQAGLDFSVSKHASFDVGYSGQFATHMLDQGGRVALKIGF